jgi:alkaline phosphatase D
MTPSPLLTVSPLDRRRFLAGVAGVAGAAALAQVPADRADATPRPDGGAYPFTLGVASGDPRSTGVVLWTRLVPQRYAPAGGMPPRPVTVEWQVARDAHFRRVVRSGTAWALPQLAHSVHVEVDGLQPDREWFYRFRYRHDVSPTGRTRTAPAAGTRGGSLAFAFASCQRWDDGWFPSYGHMAREDLDLVLHLGDYVYEYAISADGGLRKVATPEPAQAAPRDLAQWRFRYALTKSDPDLQAAHARFPWAVTWDDHEVRNDYAGTGSEDEPDLAALRIAAYQAWYEHQPVRAPARPGTRGPRIYRRLRWGSLAQIDLVDGRQYRSAPPCGWGEAQACAAGYDPSVTMLGEQQERWLYEGLAASTARWNILGSNVMLGRLDHDGTAGDLIWNDAWDGFPAARNRLTDAYVRCGVRNPVVVTGDWHSTFVNDIKRDFDDPASPVVASEIVGTSISSNGDRQVYGPYYGPMIPYNPHIKFFDGDRRGYVRCHVDRSRLTADLQMVSTVSRRDADESTLASFVVRNGRPGAQRQ